MLCVPSSCRKTLESGALTRTLTGVGICTALEANKRKSWQESEKKESGLFYIFIKLVGFEWIGPLGCWGSSPPVLYLNFRPARLEQNGTDGGNEANRIIHSSCSVFDPFLLHSPSLRQQLCNQLLRIHRRNPRVWRQSNSHIVSTTSDLTIFQLPNVWLEHFSFVMQGRATRVAAWKHLAPNNSFIRWTWCFWDAADLRKFEMKRRARAREQWDAGEGLIRGIPALEQHCAPRETVFMEMSTQIEKEEPSLLICHAKKLRSMAGTENFFSALNGREFPCVQTRKMTPKCVFLLSLFPPWNNTTRATTDGQHDLGGSSSHPARTFSLPPEWMAPCLLEPSETAIGPEY
jgi:hypothetical protein